MKILLVEDDTKWVELLMDLFDLNGSSCEICHAYDGVEALSILSNGELPDLIISDMRMPRMGGHELLMEIKKNASLSTIPFIMLSSASCTNETIKAHSCKATCHIAKSSFIKHHQSFVPCFEELIATADQERFVSRLAAQKDKRTSNGSDGNDPCRY